MCAYRSANSITDCSICPSKGGVCARRHSVIEDSVLPPTDELEPRHRNCTPSAYETENRKKNTARHQEPKPAQPGTTGKNKKRLGKKKTCWGLYSCTDDRPSRRKKEGTHAEAVKRGAPQGSAANATVWIPPLGDAQPGGRGRNARRGRGEQAELRGACGGGVQRGGGGCGVCGV